MRGQFFPAAACGTAVLRRCCANKKLQQLAVSIIKRRPHGMTRPPRTVGWLAQALTASEFPNGVRGEKGVACNHNAALRPAHPQRPMFFWRGRLWAELHRVALLLSSLSRQSKSQGLYIPHGEATLLLRPCGIRQIPCVHCDRLFWSQQQRCSIAMADTQHIRVSCGSLQGSFDVQWQSVTTETGAIVSASEFERLGVRSRTAKPFFDLAVVFCFFLFAPVVAPSPTLFQGGMVLIPCRENPCCLTTPPMLLLLVGLAQLPQAPPHTQPLACPTHAHPPHAGKGCV